MKMRFLCLQHRHWLSTDPSAALHTWFQCYEQGLKLEREQRDALAIRQAGCAMETADLLIQGQRVVKRDDITRYTHSVLLLTRLLLRQQYCEQANQVTHLAIANLEQLLAAGIQAGTVRAACEQLARMTSIIRPWNTHEDKGCASRQLH